MNSTFVKEGMIGMIDIGNKDVLVKYLKERSIIKDGEEFTIKYFGGGVSGIVAFVDKPDGALIVKQALSQLKTKDTWLCDPNRMNIEYESNRIYHELLPNNAPAVYFYDEENYLYGREAVPEGCPMWKQDLLSGLLDFQVAKKSIETLVNVHNECHNREDVKKIFADKSIFYDLRISPYIEFTVGKHPEIAEYAKRVSDEMMNNSISLVHGDYSPKNIMVIGREISVLDYEVAHYGHPAFDLAFFSNHFILKAVKFDEYPEAYLSMLEYMVSIYFNSMTFMDKKEFESTYIRTLALLFLARVDGKSPVEYLVGDDKKQALVRKISFRIINERIETFAELLAVLKAEFKEVIK